MRRFCLTPFTLAQGATAAQNNKHYWFYGRQHRDNGAKYYIKSQSWWIILRLYEPQAPQQNPNTQIVYYFTHMTKVQRPSRSSRRARLAAALALVAALTACASPPKPKQFTLRGEGAQTLNRDINGKSLSVVVHVYQLKDAREFSKLTFDTLTSGRPDTELLGPALLEKTDAIVVPGGEFTSTDKLRDETKFLGIVAYFRNPDPNHWRQLLDVETLKKSGLGPDGSPGAHFRIEDCFIKVIDVAPVLLPGQPPEAKGECQPLGRR